MWRACLLGLLPILASCAGQTSLDGFALAERDSSEVVFFVERQPEDSHQLDEAIVRVLAKRGVTAVTVEPELYDYRITYIDRWYWDMRMYMIDFRIDVRDPKTNVLLATARSYQTSLAALGKGRENIIADAIKILFEGPAAPVKRKRSTTDPRDSF